eukprot:12403027-Karenia_brevis.AAC.1
MVKTLLETNAKAMTAHICGPREWTCATDTQYTETENVVASFDMMDKARGYNLDGLSSTNQIGSTVRTEGWQRLTLGMLTL